MQLQITHNFKRNLDDIRDFLHEAGEALLFERLLEELFGQILPSLEQFPRMGVDFCKREAGSIEVVRRIEVLQKRIGQEKELRELITGDYLLLYVVGPDNLSLLSIRHHRQLSFDLSGHWPKML